MTAVIVFGKKKILKYKEIQGKIIKYSEKQEKKATKWREKALIFIVIS